MRLYKLMSRHGQKKRSLHPWFDPPPAGAPMKYDGWVWEPAEREWVEVPVARIEVEVQVPKYPRPTEPPIQEKPFDVPGWRWSDSMQEWIETRMPLERVRREMERPPPPVGPPHEGEPFYVPGWVWNSRLREWTESPMPLEWVDVQQERGPMPEYVPEEGRPSEVEGWSWSEAGQEWVATIIFGQRIGFEPPRSLPPVITRAMVEGVYPYAEIAERATEMLIHGGYTPEQARQYGITVIEMVRNMSMAASRAGHQARLERAVEVYQEFDPGMGAKYMLPVILYVTFTLVGWVVGRIMAALVWPEALSEILVDRKGTYLLGPDEWLYSKNIGKSIGGRTYYSHCGSIGDAYVRHKRARGKDGYDVIDFPGGFVETGFKFPYWVKYTWSHWVLQYIGMLESSGERFYRLKECDYDRFATVLAGYSVKQSEWCKDFHYYL